MKNKQTEVSTSQSVHTSLFFNAIFL